MMSMHQDGSLAKLLEEKGVLVEADASDASSTSS
jgi:monothiol glutaredoxin